MFLSRLSHLHDFHPDVKTCVYRLQKLQLHHIIFALETFILLQQKSCRSQQEVHVFEWFSLIIMRALINLIGKINLSNLIFILGAENTTPWTYFCGKMYAQWG